EAHQHAPGAVAERDGLREHAGDALGDGVVAAPPREALSVGREPRAHDRDLAVRGLEGTGLVRNAARALTRADLEQVGAEPRLELVRARVVAVPGATVRVVDRGRSPRLVAVRAELQRRARHPEVHHDLRDVTA